MRQAGVDDYPGPPPVDVHSVMLHKGLPLVPFPGPVFSQLVYLQIEEVVLHTQHREQTKERSDVTQA